MKKKFKKIKKYGEPVKKRKPREDIRYLGFIVDPDINGPNALTYALVNLKQEPGIWYIITVDQHGATSKPEAALFRYFRTTFVLAIKALLLYKKEQQLSKDAVILDKNIPRFHKIGAQLRNGNREDKVKGISSDFPKLRRAIYSSLFAGSGSGENLDVIWKGNIIPEAIFLWKPQNLQESKIVLDNNKPIQKIQVENFIPKTTISPDSLENLADALLYVDRGYSWQDLYRKALINSIRSETFIELTTKAEPLEGNVPQDVLDGRETFNPFVPSDITRVMRIFEKNHRILLTGSSGTGKTTSLRHLTWEFALGHLTMVGKEILPVYVPLKWFGIWPKSEDPPSLPRYVAFWIKENMRQYLTTSDIRQCSLFSGLQYKKRIQLSREDMLNFIEKEVRDWLCDEPSDFSNTVFLFDGFNEISEHSFYTAKTELVPLLSQNQNLIVSSHYDDLKNTLPQLIRFEVELLSDEQIKNYLNTILDGKGDEFFDLKIAIDARILSMARVPFYLVLMVDYHRSHPRRILPTCQGPLLQFFINKQYADEEKQEIIAQQFPGVTNAMINIFLRKVAHRLIDKGDERPEIVLSLLDEVKAILPEFTVTEIKNTAHAAELLGFLEMSRPSGEQSNGMEIISFRHDIIMAYFAAQELLNQKVLDSPATIKSYLEYTKWDDPFLLLLGFLKDRKLFQRALLEIVKLDPIFGSRCLLANNLADQELSSLLINYFPASRIKMLLLDRGDGKGIFRSRTNYPSIGKRLPPIAEALSFIMSFYPTSQLLSLYTLSSTDEIIKASIPHALVIRHGEDSLKYLVELSETKPEAPSTIEVYCAIGSLTTPEAYLYLVKRYMLGIQQKITLPRAMPSTLLNCHARLSVEQLIDTVKNADMILSHVPVQQWRHGLMPLVAPLSHGLVGTVEDWLKLYRHENNDISYAARTALENILHPLIVKEMIDSCYSVDLDPDPLSVRDIGIIGKSGIPEAEKAVMYLLEKAQNKVYIDDLEIALSDFAKYGKHDTVKNFVHFFLNKGKSYGFSPLESLAEEAPQETCNALLTEIHKDSIDIEAHELAVICLALCGYKDIESELIGIIENTLCELDKISKHYSEKKYVDLLVKLWEISKGIIKINSSNAKQILIDALKKQSSLSNKKHIISPAINQIISDLSISWERHWGCNAKTIEIALSEIRTEPGQSKSVITLVPLWTPLIRRLPGNMVIQFFQGLRQIAEDAITSKDQVRGEYMYELIERFRKVYSTRRFLEVFSGWPTITAVHGETYINRQ
jgi:hypothetical protein